MRRRLFSLMNVMRAKLFFMVLPLWQKSVFPLFFIALFNMRLDFLSPFLIKYSVLHILIDQLFFFSIMSFCKEASSFFCLSVNS